MNWTNVRLILQREIRDQLRDRRTLFMIFVLPILLYPLMGMSGLQLMQFIREHPTDILILGHNAIPADPPLIGQRLLIVEGPGRGQSRLVGGSKFTLGSSKDNDLQIFAQDVPGLAATLLPESGGLELEVPPQAPPVEVNGEPARTGLLQSGDELKIGPVVVRLTPSFAAHWFSSPDRANLIRLHFPDPEQESAESSLPDMLKQARARLAEDEIQAVVVFPPDFDKRLVRFRERLKNNETTIAELEVPSPEVYHNTAKKKSQITFARVADVLRRWRDDVIRHNLDMAGVPVEAARPFDLVEHDVADERHRDAAIWATLFPFMLLIWSLTGAFYPAVDICAGEKERGTLETLLCSPAERSEIVWGKLFTVMIFSVATVTFNLASVGLTGLFVLQWVPELPNVGPPPLLSFVWLMLAILPVSALFSALCLALAAFAKSNKEGQYYLMPLFLVTLPLVLLPMSPGFELNLGNSLIPVTGVVLVLRAAIEGDYLLALRFVLPVTIVTLTCCLLALRWAIDQFNKESVLFRESERLELGLYLRHLMRDRGETPSVPQALFCGITILIVQFLLSLTLGRTAAGGNLWVNASVTQLVAILTPAVLMAVILTRSPKATLLLRWPKYSAAIAAVALAAMLHPASDLVRRGLQELYPLSPEVQQRLAETFKDVEQMNFWVIFLLIAVLPAICEEIAFRGFILSGLRHMGHRRLAIVFSSVLFGMAHPILQQSINACFIGLFIGYLAVQSGSLLPGVLFHMTHNGLQLARSYAMELIGPEELVRYPWLNAIVRIGDYHGAPILEFQPAAVVVGLAVAVGILAWLHHLPRRMSEEESLQDAIEHQSAHPVAS